jgi:hypothetical protein
VHTIETISSDAYIGMANSNQVFERGAAGNAQIHINKFKHQQMPVAHLWMIHVTKFNELQRQN